jgi:O-antigen/teichoic acid export membrane protein
MRIGLDPGVARGIRLLLLVTIPITVFGMVFGPALVQLVYGANYAATAAPLRIMLPVFPLVALMMLFAGLLWGVGEVRVFILAFMIGGVVDIACAFLFIPAHAQVGAAIANSAGQLTASALVIAYVIHAFGPFDLRLTTLARALLVAVLAGGTGGLVLRSDDAGVPRLVLAAAVATSVFVVLSRVLRTVPDTDAAWVVRSARGPIGRWVARFISAATRPTQYQVEGP